MRDGGERGGVAPPLHAGEDSRENVQTAQRVSRALQTGPKNHCSGGFKEALKMHASGPISFIFMEVSAKFCEIIGWRPLLGILVHHCTENIDINGKFEEEKQNLIILMDNY